MIFFWSLIFIISLVFLIKCSDYFVDSSLVIGKALGIPQHIIGITLVALGTSVPELASSVFSVIRGSSSMVMSTVVGSNTSNIFLVLGITAVVARKIDINLDEIKGVLPFLILSTVVLIVGCFDGVFGRFDALLALALLIGFIAYCVHSGLTDELEGNAEEGVSLTKQWLIFAGSIAGIGFSANFLIQSLQEISFTMGIGEDIIATSALALGTSLPELAVTVTAVKKGRQSVAVGNIVGSNIFNSLMITGIPALMQPLIITESIIHLSLPAMVVATLFFLLFIIDSKINLLEGLILVTSYLIFIGWLFTQTG